MNNKKILGVCGYIANKYNVKVSIVRWLMFIAFMFAPKFIFFAYIIVGILLSSKQKMNANPNHTSTYTPRPENKDKKSIHNYMDL